jgi:ribosome-binding factor A
MANHQRNNNNSKSLRQLQVAENIKRTLSEIFLEKGLLNYSSSYISVTQVDISPDLKNAKIYLDIFNQNQEVKPKILNYFNNLEKTLRFELSKKIKLRFAPELSFIEDKTQENAFKIEKIIAEEKKNYDQQNPQKK